MSWATQVALVNTAISAVSGIGSVINYESDKVRHENLVTELVSGGILNGAMILREKYEETPTGGSGYRFIGKHDVVVTVVYSRDQSGTKRAAFDALLDAIAAKIRGNDTVMVHQPEFGEQAVSISPIGSRMFGTYLVHHAEIRFTIEESFQIT